MCAKGVVKCLLESCLCVSPWWESLRVLFTLSSSVSPEHNTSFPLFPIYSSFSLPFSPFCVIMMNSEGRFCLVATITTHTILDHSILSF